MALFGNAMVGVGGSAARLFPGSGCFCGPSRRVWRHSVTAEKAEETRVLAANQGLYNGFLAVGLIFGLLYPDLGRPPHHHVLPALRDRRRALWGLLDRRFEILLIQAAPAATALIVVWLT